ncbi:MAG TPA: PEP-CTERM sorting domain-containing protein [Acetobacteraceae bacterium]|jgi:hypothetical protein
MIGRHTASFRRAGAGCLPPRWCAGIVTRAAIAGVVAACFASVPAWAQLGQATTPAGSASVSTCAGNGFGGLGEVGNAISGGTSFSIGSGPAITAQTCAAAVSPTQSATVQTTSSGSGVWYTTPYINTATATAGPGLIHLTASNIADTSTDFAGAAAQGGFNEMFTVNGGTPGTQGILIQPIHVDGTLIDNNNGAAASIDVQVFLNHTELGSHTLADDPAYSKFVALNTSFNSTIGINEIGVGDVDFSWDYQMKPYDASNYGPSDPDSISSLVVNEDVLFAIPFTFGTPFDMGVYALAEAGERAFGGNLGGNTSSVDFGNTIAWGGPGYVLNADGSGAPFTGYTITAASGIDYSHAFDAPEPATWLVFGVGIAALGAARRSRRAAPTAR